MSNFALVLTISVCLLISFLVIKKPVLNLPFAKYKGNHISIESFWAVSLIIPIVLLAAGSNFPS